MLGMLSIMEAMAWAAMAVVPMAETVDCRAILPNWNMPFSTPVGTPTDKMRQMTGKSGRMER